MSPHEETSPDQGSLFSDIELKVIHLFPMISICTDVSRYNNGLDFSDI